MVSAATVDFTVTSVAMVFVYVVSIMTIGAVQALISAKLGDRSAIDEGYLSFDPSVYYDGLGFMSLLVFGMGWARAFPFRPEMFTAPFRRAKIFLVHMVQPLMAFLLALAAVLGSIQLIGPSALGVVYQFAALNAVFRYLNIQSLSEICGVGSPLLVIFIILVSMAALNTFIVAWSIISNCWDSFLQYIYARSSFSLPAGSELLVFIGPYLLFLFLFPLLHYAVLKIIILISLLIMGAL